MKKILLAGMVGVWATSAIAHSPLKTTTPANKTTVAEVPEEVLLDFKSKIRLTRVTMTHADHSNVPLDLSGHDGFTSDYAVPIQDMGGGDYEIEWRGLGTDGHAMKGSFSFTVE